ncbi:homoserine dehydrogenase [Limnoglobus roseus]|uniref:Homoserine dehydrogenase n=1 Tax=Limnoglobus roseus TaxID=2598579 RepID=A0A5C1A8V1_9BACT|nr:homoserine dehydrogenase [Limnoglobus roseus]QEL15779.1 homoserine dehydrogenase [Limnoglobus roseus]
MAESLGIALIGCGTVGTGVAKILTHHANRVTTRTGGKTVAVKRVVARDAGKGRDPAIPSASVGTDWTTAVADPAVQIVVELIGGTTTAKQIVLAALAAGKHVVTANKALLAEHGQELFAAARKAERVICFEAAVAGGIPIIRAMGESLAANQITGIQGILNGTSNFILSSMADNGASYANALTEAQRLGYAEADPTLDVDGSDAAHKLAVLAQIAFGVTAKPSDIEKQGIADIQAMDTRYAAELGYTIKLLAEAWAADKTVALHVAPVLLRKTDPLAQVRGAFNAILVTGDVVGETLYQGPGAGMMPTASSVVADIIDIAVGRAQKTFTAAKLWSGSREFTIVPSEKVRSKFYLRLLVKDEPGTLSEVCRCLANEQISIASVIQHEPLRETEKVVPLVIMTHLAETGRFRTAAAVIDKLTSVAGPAVYFSVDD